MMNRLYISLIVFIALACGKSKTNPDSQNYQLSSGDGNPVLTEVDESSKLNEFLQVPNELTIEKLNRWGSTGFELIDCPIMVGYRGTSPGRYAFAEKCYLRKNKSLNKVWEYQRIKNQDNLIVQIRKHLQDGWLFVACPVDSHGGMSSSGRYAQATHCYFKKVKDR